MLDAPPLDAPYKLLDFKHRLRTEFGLTRGSHAFVEAYPQRPMVAHAVPLRSALSVARTEALAYREIAAGGAPFRAPAPRVIGENDVRDFRGIARTVFLACLADATVMGSSYVLETNGSALLDFQNDERERVKDEPHLDPKIFALEAGVAHLLEPVATTAHYDEAFVALLGPHSFAFGHWMWHQLPRFVAALERGDLPDMTILVDRGMPASHYEALALAIGDRAMPVVQIARGETVRVRRAWYASTLCYIPYLPHTDETRSWEFVAAPPDRWLPTLRAFGRHARSVVASGRGERLYFSRRLDLRRKLVNAGAIEAMARERGFTILNTEDMTFAEQIAAARDARYILGPEGSAMFLTFYTRPGTKLAILDHPYVAQLTNLTAQLELYGLDVTLVTGTVVDANDAAGYPNFGYKHFADYEIDPHVFQTFLAEWLRADANRTSPIGDESARP